MGGSVAKCPCRLSIALAGLRTNETRGRKSSIHIPSRSEAGPSSFLPLPLHPFWTLPLSSAQSCEIQQHTSIMAELKDVPLNSVQVEALV